MNVALPSASSPALEPGSGAAHPLTLAPALSRGLLGLGLVAAVAAGFLVTGPDVAARAVAEAGEDLTRLLRGMAALKVLMVAGVTGGIFWRLGAAVSPARFAVYAGCVGAMAAGPGLIWDLAHVRAGAVLLHGGLLVGLIALWRDPAVAGRLAGMLASRRTT